MSVKKRFFCFSFLLTHLVHAQNTSLSINKIDSLVAEIDRRENIKVDIGHYIIPRYSDSDSTRLYNRYILDTIKRDFYKCIYDCTFRGLEQIVFYFVGNQLIKVNVQVQEYNQAIFNTTYYFEDEVVIQTDHKSSSPLWNIGRIKTQGKQYFEDFAGIIRYLDKAKK